LLTYPETISLFENTEAATITKYDESNTKKVAADSNTKELWEKSLRILRDNVSSLIYNTWFTPITPLKWSDKVITVQVPSQFFYEQLENNYYDLLHKTIERVFGDGARLQYDIVIDRNNKNVEERSIIVPAFQTPPPVAQQSLSFQGADNKIQHYSNNLNPRYSFDNFLTGESNQLAVSAAKAVAGNPGGTQFNPIFIYSETGLGKSHLLHAIGNYIVKNNPSKRVLYTHSENFIIEFVNAIQNSKVNDFVAFYRSIDVLILDDIQFLSGKEKTLDNFFHTFNALHQQGKQIVLSSDTPPSELNGIDERLISRFKWGLNVDIQKPELELRIAILKQKSANAGIELPMEIAEYIAKNATHRIRDLEGILINLIAKHTLDKKELNLDLAKQVVRNQLSLTSKEFTIHNIKELVSEHYQVPIDLIESKSRKHEIALARQMSMYLAKKFTRNSLKAIGAEFGGRDHSTVLHSCTAIDNYLYFDKKVQKDYDKLFNLCKEMSI